MKKIDKKEPINTCIAYVTKLVLIILLLRYTIVLCLVITSHPNTFFTPSVKYGHHYSHSTHDAKECVQPCIVKFEVLNALVSLNFKKT